MGNDRIQKHTHKYPIGLLNGKFDIHFLHYRDEGEALDKWDRRIARIARINLDNLIVFGTELDLCSEEDINKFNQLEFERKFFFTRKEYSFKSSIYVKEFSKNPKIGDPYQNGHILYKN